MSELLEKIGQLDGIDINDGLRRMMGKESLYERCLKLFCTQARASKLCEYVLTEDYENAYKDAHSLKGVTGNLSITVLHDLYAEFVRLYYAKEYSSLAEICAKIAVTQKMFCDVIETVN